MPKFSGVPTYESSQKHSNNGISRVVLGFAEYLPRYGWQWTPRLDEADLLVYHAGEGNGNSVDIAVSHGLHPTGHHDLNPSQALFEINRRVIQDMVIAKHIIAPSQWVADYIRHEMKRDVTVVNWGIDLDKWEPLDLDTEHSFVLWNKNRSDPVCNPAHMNEVAKRLPHHYFMSTFGEPSHNVKILGRQPWEHMNNYVKHAGVYLATTRETGDIGSREALAAGVPVVAFARGGVVDVVKHGFNGYLAEVGNYDELAYGIEWCFQHREQLRANAIATRDNLGWDTAAARIAMVFDEVYAEKQAKRPKVSVVIPCHNYEQLVGRAIESVLNQKTNFEFEVIVVCDNCDDGSVRIASKYANQFVGKVLFDIVHFRSPALTRNAGIQHANANLVLCLDADDQIAPNTLQILADAMDSDATLGIAYTGLGLEHGGQTGFPPPNPSFELMVSGYNQIPTCCMFRREDWQRVGGYRQYMEPSEDADFFMRLWAWSGRYAKQVTTAPLFIYNVHQGSLTEQYRSQVRQPDPFTARGKVSWLKQRPLPAPPISGKSNPVYHRDIPLLDVRIADKSAILSKDSLDFQFFRDWKIDSEISPLVIRLTGNDWLPDNYLSEQLKALDFPEDDGASMGIIMKKCCGGSRVIFNSIPLTDENTVLVQFMGGGAGSIYIGSPTGWRPSADIPATKAYGKKRKGDVFRMLKADYEKKPEQFKLITEQVALVAIRAIEPITIETPPVSLPPSIDDTGLGVPTKARRGRKAKSE